MSGWGSLFGLAADNKPGAGCFSCPVNVPEGSAANGKSAYGRPAYGGTSQRSTIGFESTRSGASSDMDTDRAHFDQRVFMQKSSPPKNIPRLNLGAGSKGPGAMQTPKAKPGRSCFPIAEEMCLEMDVEPQQNGKKQERIGICS